MGVRHKQASTGGERGRGAGAEHERGHAGAVLQTAAEAPTLFPDLRAPQLETTDGLPRFYRGLEQKYRLSLNRPECSSGIFASGRA